MTCDCFDSCCFWFRYSLNWLLVPIQKLYTATTWTMILFIASDVALKTASGNNRSGPDNLPRVQKAMASSKTPSLPWLLDVDVDVDDGCYCCRNLPTTCITMPSDWAQCFAQQPWRWDQSRLIWVQILADYFYCLYWYAFAFWRRPMEIIGAWRTAG